MKKESMFTRATIENIHHETPDIKIFHIQFKDQDDLNLFDYKPGQFIGISVLGGEEIPVSISSFSSRTGFLEFTIRAVGETAKTIYNIKKGESIYLSGPYGNSFPFEEIKEKNIYFIAGGIGLASLRSFINMVFSHREEFKRVKILYSARTPDDVCFREELNSWRKIPYTEVLLTADRASVDGWRENTGVITDLWKKTVVEYNNAIAFVCGPSVMIKFVYLKLLDSGFPDRDIIITPENYINCGFGKCQHCLNKEELICPDGPVFTAEQYKISPARECIF